MFIDFWRSLAASSRLYPTSAWCAPEHDVLRLRLSNESLTNRPILLLDHVFRPDGGWGIPGGFLSKGNSLKRSAARTAREIGIEVSDVEMLFAARSPDPGRSKSTFAPKR